MFSDPGQSIHGNWRHNDYRLAFTVVSRKKNANILRLFTICHDFFIGGHNFGARCFVRPSIVHDMDEASGAHLGSSSGYQMCNETPRLDGKRITHTVITGSSSIRLSTADIFGFSCEPQTVITRETITINAYRRPLCTCDFRLKTGRNSEYLLGVSILSFSATLRKKFVEGKERMTA